LKEAIDGLRDHLISAHALMAARIDFPDEGDTQDVSLVAVVQAVDQAIMGIDQLLGSYEAGRIAAAGLMVALVGEPNVGKSTLMNTLLGRERALVSAVAGTTRDYLEERCLVDGRLIRLVDTAGLRVTEDEVEAMGVDRTKKILGDADVVLWLSESSQCHDLSTKIDGKDLRPGGRVIRVATKCDLIGDQSGMLMPEWLPLSVKSGQGLVELKKAIIGACDEATGSLSEEASFITTERHAMALIEARKILGNVLDVAGARGFDECLDFELREASRALGSIIGALDTDDILDRVFSEFCIGK
jgi:tRNA modification GTPase